ncbi:CopG family transcriptional regulator [Agrobacterium tumefaciens]|nr:CopG family transcriptional regulator [Agrobacterium tumefaciens]NSZ36131.1 CopG family transcriptional regulator [Agrobacterium tumefaciens]NTB02225.1 CopG family transcriptional regulator [Agrobacterium tumefaciens]NTB22067.1 CopG family transcriptional regulator [Agrobacterium tumefaciens]NTB27453.1 CopG family transcriptional regulator [Agrobacterium tumefaciens]
MKAVKAQAEAIKPQASAHGLSFEGYLTPDVAAWVLTCIEQGHFHSPAEAVSVAMQVFIELQDYPDLREELLRREIQKSMDDPRPSIPGEEALARILEKIKSSRGHTPPSWVKVPFPE